MSNSIWKTPKETPRQEQLVAWVDRNGMHAGRFDTCYNCFCACADYRADLRKVKKWCSLENLEDLIVQAGKAERLQKAVDLAVLRLEQGKKKFGKSIMGPNKEIAMLCDIVIDEIKQLIKGE